MDRFVVNLNETGAPRYLKVAIECEIIGPATLGEMRRRGAQTRDAIISYLSSLLVKQTRGVTAKETIRYNLQRRINNILNLFVLRDRSEQARHEQERRTLEQHLMHSQKREAVGALAGGVAHDFNNFLSVIRSSIAVLSLRLADDPEARPDLDNSTEAIKRAAELVRQLLSFVRPDEESGVVGPEGDYLVISVRDSGDGIPEHIRDDIFKPLVTTKAPDKGSGLGLAMVHRLVSQCGGEIRFDSNPGMGTTFYVYLPRAIQGPPANGAG